MNAFPISPTRALILLILVIPELSFGQSQMNRAEALFDQLAYSDAIGAYKKVLKKDENNLTAQLHLGDCYRLVQNYERAAEYYQKAVTQENVPAEYFLLYGQMLQASDQCLKAIEWFRAYAELKPDDPRGASLLNACEDSDQFEDNSSIYTIKNPKSLNSDLSDFSPVFYGDGIVFTSSRTETGLVKRTHSWTDEPFLDLWYAEETVDGFKNPKLLQGKINKRYHEGPMAFNEEQIFFTRNSTNGNKKNAGKDGAVRLSIYQADNSGKGKWEEASKLPFCSDDYSVAHPALSQDGKKLFFSSDMPGGHGGSDLYYVTRNSQGEWNEPVNLGTSVNTPGDEIFPNMHADGSLFYSSDGLTGLGGLDIYSTRSTGEGWTKAINAGVPLNTTKDDFGLVWNEDYTRGFFSSNRIGSRGSDDVYIVESQGIKLKGEVVDLRDGTPVPGATVFVSEFNRSLQTDENGYFSTIIKAGTAFNVSAEKEKYSSAETAVEEFRHNSDLIRLEIEPVISIGGTVLDGLSEPVEDANLSLSLVDEEGQIIATVLSDENGKYSFGTVPKGEYEIKGEKEGFSFDAVRTESGETDITLYRTSNWSRPVPLPFKDCGRLPVLYYDYGKSKIRQDGTTALEIVLGVLDENPDMIIELSSHTDSRSSDRFNVRLSAERTQSATDWLIANGVDPIRIFKMHFGESQLVNECGDDVECPETDHQLNRRTEIRCVPIVNIK